VANPGDGLRLAREPIVELGLGRFVVARWRLQDLDGDRPVERRLKGEIDDAETTFGDLALDAKTSVEKTARQREGIPFGG